MKFILSTLLSVFILTTLSYPQTEILKLTPIQLYNHLKKYLGQRRDKEWTKYEGKLIRWAGNPWPFGTRGITNKGFLLDLSSKADKGYIFIRAYFPEKEAKKLFKLSQYDSVVFEGKLTQYSFSPASEYHFLIGDAKLINVVLAKSVPSIVGYKFNAQPSPLSGDYEFMGFDVILRNDGKMPLKGATLDVIFGDIAGTTRDVFVGPEEVKEIRIWYMHEWRVKGQRKTPPFQIPHGPYKGVIYLRDENGRLIDSKRFSLNLPPVERRQLN
ncbi:MAG: hypothetical protein DRG76_10910 [Deltaproteobacteria bacterium]|nr:MAG: hypothetical protein DRG76_10910 [Deltaproteobacteria bacterium]